MDRAIGALFVALVIAPMTPSDAQPRFLVDSTAFRPPSTSLRHGGDLPSARLITGADEVPSLAYLIQAQGTQRRPSSPRAYIAVGGVLGMVAGTVYGIDKSTCAECTPVITPLLVVPMTMMIGAVGGGVVGGIVWKVTHLGRAGELR